MCVGDLLEQIKTSTLVPQMENLQISSEDTEIQNSYDQASTETFTANGIQSGQQHTPVTVGVSHDAGSHLQKNICYSLSYSAHVCSISK